MMTEADLGTEKGNKEVASTVGVPGQEQHAGCMNLGRNSMQGGCTYAGAACRVYEPRQEQHAGWVYICRSSMQGGCTYAGAACRAGIPGQEQHPQLGQLLRDSILGGCTWIGVSLFPGQQLKGWWVGEHQVRLLLVFWCHTFCDLNCPYVEYTHKGFGGHTTLGKE